MLDGYIRGVFHQGEIASDTRNREPVGRNSESSDRMDGQAGSDLKRKHQHQHVILDIEVIFRIVE
jgi:hypothetical protein